MESDFHMTKIHFRTYPIDQRPTLANRHTDRSIEFEVEGIAEELYPKGCHVLFTTDRAYVMPTDWSAGGTVIPYDGTKPTKL